MRFNFILNRICFILEVVFVGKICMLYNIDIFGKRCKTGKRMPNRHFNVNDCLVITKMDRVDVDPSYFPAV